MTPHETYKQSVEELEKYWTSTPSEYIHCYELVDMNKTTFLTLLRNAVERLEGMKSMTRDLESTRKNDFIQSEIDHYKSEIALIEKEV